MVSYLAGRSKFDFSNIDYVTPLFIGGVAIRLIKIFLAYMLTPYMRITNNGKLSRWQERSRFF